MKVHLMYPDRDFDPEATLPRQERDLTADLGLRVIWSAMANGDRHLFALARSATLQSLVDPATITYRQDVLDDFRTRPGVVRRLYEIACGAMAGEKRIYGMLRSTPSSTLRRSVQVLGLFVGYLRQLRAIAEDQSEKVRSSGLRGLVESLLLELDDAYFTAIDRHLRHLQFKDGLWMSSQLGLGNRGIANVLRAPSETRGQWKERLRIAAPTSYSFEMHPRDEAGLDALSRLTDRGINPVADALGQATDHVLAFFRQLRDEVGFYVACLNLEEHLRRCGGKMCRPEPLSIGGAPLLTATGIYDGALTLRTDAPVVVNDLLADGRMLVMITGANSGGKSTFLRSVGLAQLMMQCGMHVCGDAYVATVCDGLFTHFAREEDAAMEHGRFDEELSRMAGIADHLAPGAMVLLNESFAGTSEWEGSEIARQVVTSLVESDIRAFFVTHLFDLAGSLYRDAGVPTLFLRAERRDDGVRSFRMLEGAPLATSYGPDLYRRMGGWGPSACQQQPRAQSPTAAERPGAGGGAR
jgi:MutS domain V